MDSVFNLFRAVVNPSESIPLSAAMAPPYSNTEQPFNNARDGTLVGAASAPHIGNETRNVAEQEGAAGEQPIRKEGDACTSTEIGSAESDGDGNAARTEEANVEPDVQVAAGGRPTSATDSRIIDNHLPRNGDSHGRSAWSCGRC
jgi:hypothetical protein